MSITKNDKNTRTTGRPTLNEVARRAGVTHQAPYHHFADRESILAALNQEVLTRKKRTPKVKSPHPGTGE